jgi:hypothetical protein
VAYLGPKLGSLFHQSETLTPTFLLSPTASQASTLRDLLNNAACRRGCWQGIEPGVTSLSQLKMLWQKEGIKSDVFVPPGGDENNAIYTWILDNRFPFVNPNPSERTVMATVSKGVVAQLLVPIYICASQVINEYGHPSQVAKHEQFYYLPYHEQGLIFHINMNIYPKWVNAVFFVPEDKFEQFVVSPLNDALLKWDEAKDTLIGRCDGHEIFGLRCACGGKLRIEEGRGNP